MPARRKSARIFAPSAWSALPGAGWSAGNVNLSGCAAALVAAHATSTNNKARWRTGLGRLGLLGITRGGQRCCWRRLRRDGRGAHGRQLAVGHVVVLGLVDVGHVEREAQHEENDGAL